jgi:hypothetical protein
MKNLIQVLKNFFKRQKVSGIAKNGIRTNYPSNFFNSSFGLGSS